MKSRCFGDKEIGEWSTSCKSHKDQTPLLLLTTIFIDVCPKLNCITSKDIPWRHDTGSTQYFYIQIEILFNSLTNDLNDMIEYKGGRYNLKENEA